ncbi:MAG: hypothetical protein MR649_05500 [Prevotella sp.]|nr:hypothetical protein [Prevotella sp.]
MKHFNLYMMGLALISSVCATAQTHQALPQPVPGVKAQLLFKKANSSRPAAQRPYTKTTYALPTKGVRMVPLAQIAKTQRAKKADEMVKKTLLTGWSSSENNGTPETCKITYDKYGRFSVIDYGTYKDLYTYDVNETGSKWSKKLVRRQTGETIDDRYKEERTFDLHNRVSTIKIYENRYGLGLMLVEEREYDYSHNAEGIEVKDVDYDIYNDVHQPGQVELLKWFAPVQSYISITYDARYDKVDFEVNGTNYALKRYYKDYNNEWVLTDTEEHYFTADGRDLGYLKCFYSDGEISVCDGQKTELLLNTPEAGYTTEIRSQMSSYSEPANTWVYNEKYVYSNNKDLPKTQANGDRSEKYYRYETSKADWDLTNVETGVWTPDGFLKETYESYEGGVLDYTETSFFKYSATGEEEGYVLPLENGGYVLETDITGVDGSYYTFYDKNHNVTRRLRAIYKDGKDSGDYSYESTVPEERIYEEWKNGKWVAVTSDLMIGDGANHMEVKFNSNGQMTQWDEYENGLHTEHVVYTYLDNGYIEQSFNTNTNKVDEYTKVTKDADNVVTYINYEYSTSTTSSQIIWGEKYVTYPTGKQVIYRWDTDTQEFVMDATTAKTLTTTAADGTQTSIYREIDNNGNVVETRKESYYDKDGEYRRETYNKVDGQWVGEYKSEEEPVTAPQFEVLDLQDPKACNDEYFYPYDNDDEEDVFPYSSTNHTSWGWKDGQWAIRNQETTVYSQPDDNTLVQTTTYLSDQTADNRDPRYEKETCYDSRKRDSRNNLIEHKYGSTILNIYDGTTTQNWQYEIIDSYTYNDEGLLTSHKHEEYSGQTSDASASAARAASTLQLTSSIITNYYYAEFDVVNGITSATADAAKPAFAVNGRTVSAVGKAAAISLYTLDGQLVATSATGHVEAPANGAFIAVSGAAKCKIVVK